MRPNVPLAIRLATHAVKIHDGARSAMCPTPQVIDGLSGIWTGTLVLSGEKEGTPFSLQQGGCAVEGDAAGRLDFTDAAGAAAEVQLLEASATTYVALVGPYQDPATNAELVTVLEARRAGDRLYGTYRVRPVTGGRATEGRFEAVRSELAA
jgi:hypothetical protein